MYFSVQKRGSVPFDARKILEALQGDSDSLSILTDIVDAVVEEVISRISQILSGIGHSIVHRIHRAYFYVKYLLSRIKCFEPDNAIRLAYITRLRARRLTVFFLEQVRVLYLLRTQNRGTDDDSDSDRLAVDAACICNSR